MKFVIKSGSTVKLFSGEMKIEALAQFLKDNFACWNSNNLTYTDLEGDKITLTTQADLDALLALNPHSQFIKFEVQPESISSEEKDEKTIQTLEQENVNEKQIVQPQEKSAEGKKATRISKGKRSASKSLKKPRDLSKKEEGSRRQSRKRDEKISSEESEKDCQSKEGKLRKLEDIIQEKVASMVDQRIKNLIPCIKNQLDQNFEVSLINLDQSLKHQGVECIGCSMNPIVGIRYKCLKCPTFNLCSNCEQKLSHEHNLLKMKKVEEKSQKESDYRALYKIGRKFFRQMKLNHSSSESQHERHSHGHRHHHGHRHWERKGKFCNEEFADHKFNKKMFKLQAIFGDQPNFKEFIEKNLILKPRELIELYAVQNNVKAEELQEKRDQMRKAKLAAFYDAPESQFEQVVKTYPEQNFRGLIMKLKELGKRTYTGENFKKMKQHFRKSRDDKVPNEKEEKMVESFDNLKKKDILNEMNSLFGEERNGDYSKFIESNAELDKQGLIAKWIENLTL